MSELPPSIIINGVVYVKAIEQPDQPKPEPSPEELKLAEKRVNQLNDLARFCRFDITSDNVDPSVKAARDQYKLIMQDQAKFESKYC